MFQVSIFKFQSYVSKLESYAYCPKSLEARAEFETAEPVVAASLYAEKGGLEGGIDLGMTLIFLILFISFVLATNVSYHTDRQCRIECHMGTVEIREANVGQDSYQMV